MPTPYITAKLFFARHLSAARTFILGFIFVIMLGAIFLWLPSSSSQSRLSFMDALFTSASAVCVTGLATIDIGKDLSTSGQIITLILFQAGGLGIITFSVFFLGIMGMRISFKSKEIVQSTFVHNPATDFLRILKSVMIYTLIIEFIGTMILFIRFCRDFNPGAAFYRAVYHAVSAFNNCGYSLFSDSLMSYRDDPTVNLTIAGLLITGGLGFIVLHEIVARLRGLQRKFTVHTRIAITTTAILIVVGTALLYIFERNHIIEDLTVTSRFLVAFFQSVTARTCGFNTVDIGSLTNDSILVLLILMFIGASPGSTGGGIKTTSAAMLFLLIWNRLRGNQYVNIFDRTIPPETVTKAISMVLLSAFSIVLITSVLLFAQSSEPLVAQSRHFFMEYFFEAVSAFGTVGLSLGVTPQMNEVQKFATIILMFAGRVGPMTLGLALTLASRKKSIAYAEESIMVG